MCIIHLQIFQNDSPWLLLHSTFSSPHSVRNTRPHLPWYLNQIKNLKIEARLVQHCCKLSLNECFFILIYSLFCSQGSFCFKMCCFVRSIWKTGPKPTDRTWTNSGLGFLSSRLLILAVTDCRINGSGCCSRALCCCWIYSQSLELHPLQMAPAAPGLYWIAHVWTPSSKLLFGHFRVFIFSSNRT